jgi:hypothetical protein
MKGKTNNPKGRPKGQPNKTTQEIRGLLERVVVDNFENVQIWITETAKANPARATELILKCAEFAIPRLRAIDLSSNGETLQQTVVVMDQSTADELKRL